MLRTLLVAAVSLFVFPAWAQSEAEVKLAAPGLRFVQLSSDLANFYSDHLAQQLTQNGLRVVTANEIQTLMGIERQKQLMTCSDEQSNCMAELANALGVDGLVTGSIGKFGDSYQTNLKILSSKDLAPLAAYSSRVKGDERLLDELSKAARVMAPEVFKKLKRKPPSAPPRVAESTMAAPTHSGSDGSGPTEVQQSAGGKTHYVPWIVMGGGVAALGASAIFYAQAFGAAGKLRDGGATLSGPEAQAALDDGQRSEVIGAICGVAGLAAVTTGVVLLVTQKKDGDAVSQTQDSVQPIVGAGPRGMVVGLSGSF